MFCLSYSLSLFGSGSDKDKSILAKKNFENQKQKKITFEKLTKNREREKGTFGCDEKNVIGHSTECY